MDFERGGSGVKAEASRTGSRPRVEVNPRGQDTKIGAKAQGCVVAPQLVEPPHSRCDVSYELQERVEIPRFSERICPAHELAMPFCKASAAKARLVVVPLPSLVSCERGVLDRLLERRLLTKPIELCKGSGLVLGVVVAQNRSPRAECIRRVCQNSLTVDRRSRGFSNGEASELLLYSYARPLARFERPAARLGSRASGAST
jgi:hypothetical protein